MVAVSLVLQPNRPIAESVAIAQLAEDAGFEGIWVSDENPGYGFRDVWVVLAAIAQNTKRILFGAGVSPVVQEHPILPLIACTSLDELAPGRVVVGIGPGGTMTLPPLRLPMWDRPIRMMRETILFYRRLMAGETLTDPYSMIPGEGLRLDPLPDSPMKIMLGLRGPQMAKIAGAYADWAWMGLPRAVHDETIELIHGAATKKGRKDRVRTMNSVMVAINDDLDEAVQAVARSSCYQVPDTPPHIRARLGISEELVDQLRTTIVTKGIPEAAKLLDYETVAPLTAIGSVDQVLEALNGYLKGDLDELILSPRWERPYPHIMADLKTEILPHLKS